MNKKQVITLCTTVCLLVFVFIGYGLMINNLIANPQIKNSYSLRTGRDGQTTHSYEIKRTNEINSAIQERNMISAGLALISVLLIFFVRDKNKALSEKQIGYKENQDINIQTGFQVGKSVNYNINNEEEKNKIINSLLSLKDKGIISEEEFQNKISKLN